ncbi:FHA domain-containing protein [Exilibacterium tricleocarpae]|uniref:FHA domain-containing protein n=1 Tax=Exilibacterium tricleocarpae TaxID=2591008 RepID=A0A545TUT9_9GAMM|nr:FHA domain-containing protein [Exilibacterium tricleocarpae]TQV80984.1 FHA domain-containing protein [Exilibacterium tricleocarpae]
MLKLRFKNNKHNAVWLVEPKVTVGRETANDLVVDDASVAATHAEILVDHEQLTLVNLSGGQALFVNNTAVPDRTALQKDDVVTLGKVELEVVDPKSEPKATATVMREDKATGWSLKANHTALSNRVFSLKKETVVGRSNECDITLAAAHLSRRHATLTIRSGQLFVTDLGSSNGTFLNGKRITEARVKRGDELRFDTLSFGVMGPAEDMDKTSVRSAGAVPAPKPKAAVSAKSTSTSRKPSTGPQAGASGSEVGGSVAGDGDTAGRGGMGWLAWLLVAGAAVAAGAWYLLQQGGA